MKVSIIIPYYNCSAFIKNALDSIKLQNINSKVYIVNDGSYEHERVKLGRIVKGYKNVEIIDKKNGGLSSARNVGIEVSKEEFILFLDSDDLLGYGQIANQLQKINENVSDICITKYCTASSNLGTIANQPSYRGEGLSQSYIVEFWERGLCIPIHSVLFRRSTLLSFKFDEQLRSKEDFDFWLRFFQTPKKIAFLDEVHSIYRVVSGSMARSKGLSIDNIYRVTEKLLQSNIPESSKQLACANVRINYGLWQTL